MSAVTLRSVDQRRVPDSRAVDAARVAVWRRVRRLLAVRVDNLGDVLMTTPALAAAAASVPAMSITLLGGNAATALAPHLPMVDDVIAVRVPWVRHDEQTGPEDERALIATLAAGRFDAAVIFTVCTQSALPAAMICRMAGIPLRLACVRENPYGLLTDWVPETDGDLASARHEVRRQLDLVARVGWSCDDDRLRFALKSADVGRVQALLARERLLGLEVPPVVVHVGATAPSRRWPPERFGSAADLIVQACGAPIIFTGSDHEAPLIDAARAAMRCPSVSLAGRLSLGELAALIARAGVLLTNNSGPAHIAAAVGAPIVDLYALTNPQHTPWQVPSRVLNRDVPCRNCLKSRCAEGHHRCLLDVSPAEAARAALELLDLDESTGPSARETG
ncbi:MAG TPA: glycosyltransferase family 9 protein [Burkholderiaceae bacterium]|nr:glycosyltransferase family 9 protein [Burkholderiaceae bacterium]